MKTNFDKNNFFKLSYPPNEKNPSIVNCLKLSKDNKFGRHIITTRQLNSGDIIAIEKPFYKSLDVNALHGRCLNCFQSRSSQLKSCPTCGSVKFCSKECEKISWERFHKYECGTIKKMTQDDAFYIMIQRSLFQALHVCGSLENLENLVKGFHTSTTVFDLDLNRNLDEVEQKLVLVCYSLEDAQPTELEMLFAENFVERHEKVKNLWRNQDQRSFLITFVTKLIGIMNRNSFTMHWTSSTSDGDETGCGIFPFASLINHSCSPNLFRVCVDGSVALTARHPIQPNEQLFICYQ